MSPASSARSLLVALLFLFGRAQLHAQVITTTPDVAVRVMGVTITGNTKTRDRIILRELIVHEGDSLSSTALYDKLERSRQNLMNTALFNTVSVQPLYLAPGAAMVEVTVNERWYIWPALIFDLADPNFNTWWLTKDFSRVNYGLYLYKYNFRG
ncbi:MAG TPA: POTRA domain-containing protein, partial [Flavobacteriales bacterium]|nr:POTRA domain-containing protein [Flavobacteriales bacterium]